MNDMLVTFVMVGLPLGLLTFAASAVVAGGMRKVRMVSGVALAFGTVEIVIMIVTGNETAEGHFIGYVVFMLMQALLACILAIAAMIHQISVSRSPAAG